MKNAGISVILGIVLISFFSFTNSRPVTLRDNDDISDSYLSDTVPTTKEHSKTKSKTEPYDSFGKPKKMDTTQVNQLLIPE